jgi:hypothetical protein
VCWNYVTSHRYSFSFLHSIRSVVLGIEFDTRSYGNNLMWRPCTPLHVVPEDALVTDVALAMRPEARLWTQRSDDGEDEARCVHDIDALGALWGFRALRRIVVKSRWRYQRTAGFCGTLRQAAEARGLLGVVIEELH